MAYQFDATDLVPGGGVLPKLKDAAKDAASRLGTILPGLGNASWAARDVLRYLEGKKQREQYLNTAGRSKPPQGGLPMQSQQGSTLADVANPDPFVPEEPPRGERRLKWPLSVRTPLQKLTYAAKIAKYVNTLGWPASAVLHALELSGKYPFEPFEEYYQAHDIADLFAAAKSGATKSLSSSYKNAPYIFADPPQPPPPPKWWNGPRRTHQGGPGEKPPRYPPGHPKAWTDAHRLRWFALNAKGQNRDDAEEAEFSELNSHPDNWHIQVQNALMSNILPRTSSFSDSDSFAIPGRWAVQMDDANAPAIRTAYYYLKHHCGGGLTRGEALQFSEVLRTSLPVQFGAMDYLRSPVESTLDLIGSLPPHRLLVRGAGGLIAKALGGDKVRDELHSMYDSTGIGLEKLWKYGWKGVKGGYKAAKWLGLLLPRMLHAAWNDFDPEAHRNAGLRDGEQPMPMGNMDDFHDFHHQMSEDNIPGGGDMSSSDDPNVYGKLARRATQFEQDDFGRGPWNRDYEYDPNKEDEYDDEPGGWVLPTPRGGRADWSNESPDESLLSGIRNVNPHKPPQSGDDVLMETSPTDLLKLVAEKLGPGKPISQENIVRLVKRLQSAGILDSTGTRENLADKFTAAPEGGFHDITGTKYPHGDPSMLLRYLEAYENFRKQAEQTPQMSVDADAPNSYAQHVQRATQFAAVPQANSSLLAGPKRKVRMGQVPREYKERVAGAPDSAGPKTRVTYKRSGRRMGRKQGQGVNDLAINRVSNLKQPTASVGFAVDDDAAAAMVTESHPFHLIKEKHGLVHGVSYDASGRPHLFVQDNTGSGHILGSHPLPPNGKDSAEDSAHRPHQQRQFSADDYAASLAARHPEYYGEPGHNAHFTPVLPQSMLGHRG